MSDLIDVSVAAEMTGLSEQTVYRRTRQGTFPKPLLVDTHLPRGPKELKRWDRKEVAGWVMKNGIDNMENARAQADDASFLGMVDEMDKDVTSIWQRFDAWYEANKFVAVPGIVGTLIGLAYWVFG